MAKFRTIIGVFDSRPEALLAAQLHDADIPFEHNVKIIPGRKFMWDFVIGDTKLGTDRLLVEINGGVWTYAGHSTGTGIVRDYEKLNLATLSGYRALLFTPEQVEDGTAIATIMQYME
jgi:hypothetical protein